MPCEVSTPLDRLAAQTRPSAERKRKASICWKRAMQDGCMIFLVGLRFALSTVLLVLGLPLFVFLLLAGWDLHILFAQLGNLAHHYLAASPAARIAFSNDLKIVLAALAGLVACLRLPGLVREIARSLDRSQTQGGGMNKNKWATNLLATLKPGLLMLVTIALALWMAWVSRALTEPHTPQIVTVRLAQTMGAFIEREARTGGDGAASRLRTLAYLEAADAAVTDMGRDGRIVLVAEAVLAGDAPDATAELEARIAARLTADAAAGAERR